MFATGHLFGDGEAAELESDGAAGGVGGDDVAGKIANHQAQGIALHSDLQRRGSKAHGGGVLDGLHVDGFAARPGKYRPGSVLGESAGRDAHSNDIVTECGDAQSRDASLDFNTVAQRLGTGYGFDHGGRL